VVECPQAQKALSSNSSTAEKKEGSGPDLPVGSSLLTVVWEEQLCEVKMILYIVVMRTKILSVQYFTLNVTVI
jgi:hypothetical protein